MMVAILYPQRRVLAVCGDGGFMMNSQEVETAVRLKLNLVVLILRGKGVEDRPLGLRTFERIVVDFDPRAVFGEDAFLLD